MGEPSGSPVLARRYANLVSCPATRKPGKAGNHHGACMTSPAADPTLTPHQHVLFTVERLKALAVLLTSEGVGYSVTNLEGNVASSLFEIFESGLAEVQAALNRMEQTRCCTCCYGRREDV